VLDVLEVIGNSCVTPVPPVNNTLLPAHWFTFQFLLLSTRVVAVPEDAIPLASSMLYFVLVPGINPILGTRDWNGVGDAIPLICVVIIDEPFPTQFIPST